MDKEKIFAKAKRILLRDGHHDPIIIVETKNETYMGPVHLPTWNSDDGRTKSIGFFLFGHGIHEEESERAEDVTHITIINEVWMALASEEERRTGEFQRASTNPDKKEALMVLSARSENGAIIEYSANVAQIIRAEGTLDLLPIKIPGDTEYHSGFFRALLAGMKSEEKDELSLAREAEAFCFPQERPSDVLKYIEGLKGKIADVVRLLRSEDVPDEIILESAVTSLMEEMQGKGYIPEGDFFAALFAKEIARIIQGVMDQEASHVQRNG